MILAGDIGGTKCNLALYEIQGQSHRQIAKHRYESREFSAFDKVISRFLLDTRAETNNAAAGAVEAAGFGVAGPVIDGRVRATNLPWIVDAAALSAQLGTRHVVLLNDLEATGYSLAHLTPSDFSTLNRGVEPPNATQATQATQATKPHKH